MTPIQACKETKELWTEMARIAGEGELVWKVHVPGPWQEYRNQCPCCEYTGASDCANCPMFPEWEFYSQSQNCPCEDDDSPYERWRNLRPYLSCKVLCIDVEFFCLLVAEMAEEAEMRHIAESQPSWLKIKILNIFKKRVKN